MNAIYRLDAGDEPIAYRLTDAGELAPRAEVGPGSPVAPLDGETWDRLIELELVCVCGVDQGDHDADAPHGCPSTECSGFEEIGSPESERLP